MTRKQGVLAGVLGAIAGALVGIQYLNDAGGCIAGGGNGVQCAMYESIGPFISAVAIGLCVAVLAGHCIAMFTRRTLGPKPASKPSRRPAVEVDDAYLQTAVWGRPPGSADRSAPVPASSRAEPQPLDTAAPPPEQLRAPSRGVGGLGGRGKPVPSPHRTA